MQNKEIVTEVRELLFHFMKAYGKLEDKHNIVNSYDVNSNTCKYLADVKTLFDDFTRPVLDIYIMVMKSLGEDN